MTTPSNSSGPGAAFPYADQGLDLHARVVNALYRRLAIPRNRIDVRVEDDLVTLRGAVERTWEKSFAEALAQSAPGIVAVQNEIMVRPESRL